MATPITGNETFWGGLTKPTAATLALINSSPTLVQELNDYQAAVNDGKALPFSIDNFNTGTLNTATNNLGQLQIDVGVNRNGAYQSNQNNIITDLSYELGKFEEYQNDQALYESLLLSPNDPSFSGIATSVAILSEQQSFANNAVVQREIYLAQGVQIGLNGEGAAHANGALQAIADSVYAGASSGTPPADYFSALVDASSGVMGNFPAVPNSTNSGYLTFTQLYSGNVTGVNQFFRPAQENLIHSNFGLNGSEDLTNVSVNYNSSANTITSTTMYFSDGTKETLNFANSQISTAVYYGSTGGIASTITYTHNSDGSYSATMSDGTGAVVSTQNFSGSGAETQTFTNPSSTADVNASGVTFTTNANTIDVNGADYDTTILNGNHVINAQAGDTFQLTGVGYNVNLSATGAASTVTFQANSGGAVNGSGATVDAAGSDGVTVNGNSNQVTGSSGDTLNISGAGNTVNTTADTSVTLSNTANTFDTINGSGDQFGSTTAGNQASGIHLAGDASVNVNGSNNGISEATGDNVGVYGGGDTINATANSLTYVASTNGSYDNVNVSGDTFGGTVANGQGTGVWLATNAQVNVYGNNNGITVNSGDSMGAYGGGDTINATANSLTYVASTNGSYDNVNVSGDTFGGTVANGQGTGVWLATNAQVNVYGNNNGITVNSGDSMGAYGGGDTINATANSLTYVASTNGSYDNVNVSGDTFGGTVANGQGTGVWLATNAQANVDGNNNGITVNSGDSMGAYGGGDTINATANSLTYVASTNGSYDNVNVSGDTFGGTVANGQGTGVWLATNAQANVDGNNNGITVNSGDSMGAYGGGDTINATANSLTYVASTNGSYDNVNVSGDTFGGTVANGQGTGVWLATNAQANVDGNNNGITVNSGDSMGAYGGGDTINATANSLTYVASTNGSYDNVNVSGDTFGGTVANGQGTGVWLATNAQVNVYGNNNGIAVNSGDSMGAYGGGDTINATANSLTYVTDTNGVFDTINASGDVFGGKTANGQGTGIWINANSQANVDGSNDGISLDGGNTIDIDGQHDQVDGSGDTVDFSGSTTGDIVTGNDDSGSGWSGVDYVDDGTSSGGSGGTGDPSGGDEEPPPDDGGTGLGFSGNRQTINAELDQGAAQLAQLEQSQGLSAAAVKQGLAQATEMSTDTATSAGNSANVLEGARWNDPTVTWSMGTTNGAFDQTEQHQIDQAFATWAAASGLQFVEVSSPSQADISIGWGNLDTSQTGAIGLTTYNSSKGVFSAGTQIQLESSAQDALTPGAHGELKYSGTDATFSQTVLHEIGHALGLAENADTTSIMNYDLTSSNQTLDQTDLNGIQALYGSSAQTAALIQAMAGHAPSSSATSTSIAPAEQASQHVQLLAGAH
ncbi:beta strand repeat-containing protein [Burkholderia sp. LMG 21824]|uniref:beta strand repeat-containing protein n=1 Tax=Burkholderia sp. LMG 21824 TaxID=3158172 RepID=UPI003C2AE904